MYTERLYDTASRQYSDVNTTSLRRAKTDFSMDDSAGVLSERVTTYN